jgi:hypothetical protein
MSPRPTPPGDHTDGEDRNIAAPVPVNGDPRRRRPRTGHVQTNEKTDKEAVMPDVAGSMLQVPGDPPDTDTLTRKR